MTAAISPHFSFDLTGEVVLVTGASSGLGCRFAELLAACGAKVALAARRLDRLEALAEEIRSRGGTAEAFAFDAARTENLGMMIDDIEARLGRVTILINNAGMPDAQHATSLSADRVQQVIDVNLKSVFLLSTEVARRLIAAKQGGRIVNIALIAAYHYAGQAAALYSVTKSSVVRLTEALAVEWARFNINVNGIAPGVFASEMSEGMIDRMGDALVLSFPRKRIGRPEQMDGALLFLVSPSSDFVTGTIIKIDDGQTPR